jgi:flagellar biosynthetic protein FliQ
MTTTQVLQIGRDLIVTALLVSLPTLVVSLVVGLVISILQTLTSIQEQTLSFAPRIIAVGIALVVCMPWTLRMVLSFTSRMFGHIAEAGL